MPCIRGIEVSLTTKPKDEKIPEYPHPEGTSARILGALQNCTNGQASQPKAGPTVAVYVPSIPGTRFAINYKINSAPPAPCKYVFFRLYINGRPIAAWGIDPVVRSKGRVVQSLWAPCTDYNEQVGFEGRNFVFLPGQENKSVAEDGGLIEIQVFRAKERRARAPRLEEFRYQENYGIATPSVGLLDQPQDACFYDWHLLDAKDSPFATFRLHYRSWRSLKQLNLVPATELELLCAASPKALRVLIKAGFNAKESKNAAADEQSSQSGSSDEAVFHDCKEEPEAGDDRDDDTGFYFLKSPPELFPAAPPSLKPPQPSKALRDAYHQSYLQRPLPQLPVEEPSVPSRRYSMASTVSATMSITPSLLEYVEEGSLDPDEVEVGVAQVVQLTQSGSTLDVFADDEPAAADTSISDYRTSPRSPRDSALKAKLSPSCYLPTTGSGLERGIALFTSPKQSLFSRASKSRQSLPSDFYSQRELSPSKRADLSRSEGISGAASPRPAEAFSSAARRQSSPQTSREAGKSLFAGLRKMKLGGSPSKPAGVNPGRDTRDGGSIVRRAMGSWL